MRLSRYSKCEKCGRNALKLRSIGDPKGSEYSGNLCHECIIAHLRHMRDDLVKNKQSVLTLLQTYRIQATQLQANPEKNIVDPNGKVLPAKAALEILERVTFRAEEVLKGVNEALDRVCIATPAKFGLPPISTKRISLKSRKKNDDQLVGRAKSNEEEV